MQLVRAGAESAFLALQQAGPNATCLNSYFDNKEKILKNVHHATRAIVKRLQDSVGLFVLTHRSRCCTQRHYLAAQRKRRLAILRLHIILSSILFSSFSCAHLRIAFSSIADALTIL